MPSLGKHGNGILRISLRAAAMVLAIALMLVGAQSAQAQTFNVLHTFTGGIDGSGPEAGLTLDRAGNLYGTASYGSNGYGTVYKLTNKGAGWTFSPLYSFGGGNDGAIPLSRVIFGPNGSLYGTTSDQGEQQGIGGTVFNLKPPASICKSVLCPWTETVLYRFPESGENGLVPGYGDLVFDHAGNLYGTTLNGGAHSAGVAYELTPSGTQSVLYNFVGDTGQYPYNGVIFDNAGNLHGTTYEGGSIYGTIFELTSSGSGWTDNTLHILQTSDGANPYGGVIFDQAGNLYGTTSVLGANGSGTVFELSPSGGTWTLNVLYNFVGSFGPYGGLTMDAAGNLYGTTFADGAHQFGSVFKLTHSNGSWTYTDLYDFTGGSDGGYPYGVVAVDANGNLYGTASHFGTDGYGVVWEITP